MNRIRDRLNQFRKQFWLNMFYVRLKIYTFCSSVCIVQALCMVTIHSACYNGDIEVGPDSRKVYLRFHFPKYRLIQYKYLL